MTIRGRYNPKGPDTHKGSVEIIAPGNVPGDNGNWRLIIVGANLEFQKRIGGSWVFASGVTPPP